MPVDSRGRVCCTFTHNPSTLRSASQRPNLQNLPRSQGPDDPATIIRNLIVAPEGYTLYARDFSGIEAVLVGYFAQDKDYIRLSKVDVHSYYTAYAIHALEPSRIGANDLPLVSWDDAKLFTRLKEIKKEFKFDRNHLYKHLVHGANFMQGAYGAREKIFLETGMAHDVKVVQRVMDTYFELFPRIRGWHTALLAQADKDGYLRNPFGYIHRFNRVYEWEKQGGRWTHKNGPQANQVIAFLPQSTAAGIIKEAMLRIYFDHPDIGAMLRLLVHDELFFEVILERLEEVDRVVKMEMERPIPELALPPAWGMGPYLSILTEAKQGPRWGQMK